MIMQGDLRAILADFIPGSIQCAITSPPYFAQRRYGTPPQIWGGRPDCDHGWQARRWYREGGNSAGSQLAFSRAGAANAQRIRDTRWREDEICAQCRAWRGELGQESDHELYIAHLVEACAAIHRVLRQDGTFWLNLGDTYISDRRYSADRPNAQGLKHKDLIGIPWAAAFALRAAGWHLRADIIWHKSQRVPEGSALDRPDRAHEHLFLLTKSPSYRCDRRSWERISGQSWGDVWTIPPARGAGHPAAMPAALALPCILAASAPGDTILDPFAGGGTVMQLAEAYQRRGVGVDLASWPDAPIKRGKGNHGTSVHAARQNAQTLPGL